MDPKLKNLFQILWQENVSLETLTKALEPHWSVLKNNESDRLHAVDTVKRLQKEWLEKKACCN